MHNFPPNSLQSVWVDNTGLINNLTFSYFFKIEKAIPPSNKNQSARLWLISQLGAPFPLGCVELCYHQVAARQAAGAGGRRHSAPLPPPVALSV